MVVRIKGIKRFWHRKSGIWYSYHRATGTRLEPPNAFGSPEFFTALAAASPETHPRDAFDEMAKVGALVRPECEQRL
jgi:hypothetical protein